MSPDRKPDPENKAKLIDDYWAPGQKMMGDIKFLDTLRAYDKDNIPPAIMKKIRDKYVNHPLFDPNNVKKVSTGLFTICAFCLLFAGRKLSICRLRLFPSFDLV